MKRSSKPAAKNTKAKATSAPGAKQAKEAKAKPAKKKASNEALPVLEAIAEAAAPASLALVRDRYVMPESDYALLIALKKRAKAAGRSVKKSELLRAGLHALRESGSAELMRILDRLTPMPSKKKDKQ